MKNIDEIIQEIWEADSHIPFMQSKEILKYGYMKALERNDHEQVKIVEKIVEKPVIEEKQISNIEKSQIELDLLLNLKKCIEENRDLMQIYQSLKNRINTREKKIKKNESNTAED